METAAVSHHYSSLHNEGDYESFLTSIRSHFQDTTQRAARLFTTNSADLFDVFLSELPEGDIRQHYTCHACKRFVNTYGGLVAITDDGHTVPVMWPDVLTVPALYRDSVYECSLAVSRAKVTGIHLSKKTIWGQPATGEWHHMSVETNGSAYRGVTQTAAQVMAEKREDFTTLIRGLQAFPIEAIEQAVTLLKTESLYRSEKCLGVAEWLIDMHKQRESVKDNRIKRNLLWLAVATAPAGFCHVRSTMIGTLLEDIVKGLPFETVKRKFASKMHPLQYQRPQALPSRGNIAQAEKVIEQLKAAGALARRFARLDEIPTVWMPKVHEAEPTEGGVFGHLRAKEDKPIGTAHVPSAAITWDKFSRTVLPDAERIEFYVPRGRASYAAIVTATNADAPPILQWDTAENRNPFSVYFYHGGSVPGQWNLTGGTWHPVTGICLRPSMWNGGYEHHGASAFFILDGAKDTANKSLALFPETLKAEFHGIRATIEAFSRRGDLDGEQDASACGIGLSKGSTWNYTFRVTVKGARLDYKIDRWD